MRFVLWRIRYGLFITIVLAGTCSVQCVQNPVETRGEKFVPKNSISRALEKVSSDLIEIPGVVGTGEGICYNKPCVRVYVIQESPELSRRIHETIKRNLGTANGLPVVIEQTGQIHTLPEGGENAR